VPGEAYASVKDGSIQLSEYGFPAFRCARPVTSDDVKALDDDE